MPVITQISINERKLQSLFIARMTKNGMNADSVNTYAVVCVDYFLPHAQEPQEHDYMLSDVFVEHRYGDSELILVAKALCAYLEKSAE